MSNLNISVIISTYNSEEWLEKVLESYKYQDYQNFEVIIADDGSRASTKELIDSYKADYPVDLRHIWHEDLGYRRQELLNKCIVETAYDYILMTDGDCIARKDFVSTHAKFAERGYFLSGGYLKLNMVTSKAIKLEDIKNGNCFSTKWLTENGKITFKQSIKLKAKGNYADFLDYLTPTGATFNNCNSSAWKEDLIAINGYDERMQYGGPDRELGERLHNNGIKSKQIRHKAIVLHLDHPRGYKTKESIQKNEAIRGLTKVEKRIWTDYGIKK
ncbi:glycosyltransferase [Paucihalobacter ruber]|uniref:Glycosyltransferase n=1 Tax=Paucihalobacter ruber TaxID=2567861 RepID=A0A506PG84_9FLAO|nr:glycosyltransferase family 2 protein [Paucihalobacter ruber]TPV32863.1 glycosyltransferase [Paucihalobacter ruber]